MFLNKLGQFYFNFFGIKFVLHSSLLLVLFALLGITYFNGYNLYNHLMVVWYFCVLYLCIFLHEAGHAFTAKFYNADIKDVILSAFGGVTRLSKQPKTPLQESLIAAGGPMVNLFILIGSYIFSLFFDFRIYNFQPSSLDITKTHLFYGFIIVNAVLFFVNIIPASPLDGGKIVSGVLNHFFSKSVAKAVLTALNVAMFATCLFLAFYFKSTSLLVLGVFLLISLIVDLFKLLRQNHD